MCSEQILEYLKANCWGRSRAMPSSMLERQFHISEKELQRRINRLRRQKHPIACLGSGYFYAGTAGELLGTIRSLKTKVKGYERVIDALMDCMEQYEKVEDAAGDYR